MSTDNELHNELFGRNRKLIIAIFIFSFVINILALTGSLFMLQVYDRVIPSGSIPTLVALSGIVLLLYCYFGLLDYVRSRIFVRVGKRLEESLRVRAFDIMSKVALSKTSTAGTLPVQDLGTIRQFISGQGPLAYFDMPYERLTQFFKQVPLEEQRIGLPEAKGQLTAEGVTLMLPGIEKPLLQNVSFKVDPGTALGIIGPTGAGKSTLARAITGVVPLTRGTVRMDGATPDQFGEDLYGRMIGYVPQDVQILDGTVVENIARFEADFNESKVIAAAQLADIHEFILRLPQGYETRLQEAGSRLSAGQRQRVALARALYGDPKLLVLDEPNSNLDAEGEAALDKAIRGAQARGAGVVLIAHRPSALNAVTHLLVMQNGQVQAYGPRDEVLAKLGMQPMRQAQPAAQASKPAGTSVIPMAGKLAGQVQGSS